MPLPPEPVLAAFHAEASPRRAAGEVLGTAWDNGIHLGDVVYAEAREWSGWSAKVREKLELVNLPNTENLMPVDPPEACASAWAWRARSCSTRK